MFIHMENLKEKNKQKNLLELINRLQQSFRRQCHFPIGNQFARGFEIKNTLLFMLALPQMQYLNIRLATCNYYWYKEKHKALVEDNK